MGLFDQQMTLDQLQAMERARLQALGANLLLSIKGTSTQMYNSLWFNPQGLTPQQVADAFGTNAGAFWGVFKGLADFAQQVDPSFSLINPGVVTINQDGTATISGV